jgi:P pilus assembly chaperone PapD
MKWRCAKTLRNIAAAAVLAGCMTAQASAMSVTPIHVEMASVGSTSRTQITVVNDGKQPLPVETSLSRLSLSETGERTLAKAGEEFLVFPPQAMIPPGGTQVFRLQWVGDPMLAQSQSYMLNVSQVPVKLPKGQSKLQVVMSFGVVINVAPQQASPALKVVGTGLTTDKSGKRRAFVTLENPTKHHALLPDGRLSLSGAGWSHTFTQTEMREKIGIGLVQPGKRRRFLMPVDLPAAVTQVQASLDYKGKR